MSGPTFVGQDVMDTHTQTYTNTHTDRQSFIRNFPYRGVALRTAEAM